MSKDEPLLKRLRRPLVLAIVGALFLAFVGWIGPGFRDDLWFLRFDEGCNRGDADACAQAGWRYLRGRGVAQDKARGHKLVQDACHGGLDWACAAVGDTHWWNSRKPIGLSEADTKIAAEACKGGDVAACDAANVLGVSADTTFAAEQTKKRCRSGDALACWAIFPQAMAENWDIVPDLCRKSFVHGCNGLLNPEDGNIYRQIYWYKTRAAFAHEEERRELLKSWVTGEITDAALVERLTNACGTDPQSCVLAAKLRAKNAGIIELAQDWSFARAHYDHACANDNAWGCWGVAQYREIAAEDADAVRKYVPDYKVEPASEMYRRSCELGNERACSQAAAALEEEHGDPSKATDELERHCKAERLHACDTLIVSLRANQNFERAEAIQEAVCKAGGKDYCDHWLLGRQRP